MTITAPLIIFGNCFGSTSLGVFSLVRLNVLGLLWIICFESMRLSKFGSIRSVGSIWAIGSIRSVGSIRISHRFKTTFAELASCSYNSLKLLEVNFKLRISARCRSFISCKFLISSFSCCISVWFDSLYFKFSSFTMVSRGFSVLLYLAMKKIELLFF